MLFLAELYPIWQWVEEIPEDEDIICHRITLTSDDLNMYRDPLTTIALSDEVAMNGRADFLALWQGELHNFVIRPHEPLPMPE